MGISLLKMKYTILFTTFIFALVSSEADLFSNLSDDTFCEYVGTWVDRAEALTPGFKWNIEKMCQGGKYQLQVQGLFCDVLTSYYGNGESWCSSYSSCETGPYPDTCRNKENLQFGKLLNVQKILLSMEPQVFAYK